MSLSNFFKVNLPYGIKKNSKGDWLAFNREYAPIGWNKTSITSIEADDAFAEIPIYTNYKGLTDAKLLKIAGDEKSLERDEQGKIKTVYLYNDGTNPSSKKEYWNDYFDKIKQLSILEVKR